MTPDSSAIVAAFAPWHPLHERSLNALRGADDLVAHAELETYSVLTRLPAPFRVEPALAAEYLTRRYGGARLVLSRVRRGALLRRLASIPLAGGATYDAVIALTAAEHDHELVTCDHRATATYERLGVGFELV